MPDLICFSHLRWNFVFQRPQHLMTRYPGRVFFMEEPVMHPDEDNHELSKQSSNVWVITPHLSNADNASHEERLSTSTFRDTHIGSDY